jgi:SNF2 family DNA or RNA helicase
MQKQINDLFEYQQKAVNLQCTHPESVLWLDMGLGKTTITLTSIAHLIRTNYLKAVLIVAPIRVCRLVWRQESMKWSHTQHLTFSMVMGNRDQRTRALLRKANIYLINYENLKWLSEVLHTYYINKSKPLPFDGMVWDEISKMKNSSTNRVKSFMEIFEHFKWKTGLTGTPAANGYADLHGQYLVIDGGVRLGTSKTAFRNRFYYKNGPYRYKPFDNTEVEIKNLIGDITLQMSAEDYNPLPDLIVNDIYIDMDQKLRTKYEQLEKEFFFFLDNGEGVEVFNAASLTNKLLQFSNGAVYPIPGLPLWESVHDLKLEALEDVIEEANGQQILCAYAYRSDAQRIMERFKHLKPINLTDCKSESSLRGAMARWKAGDCPLMIGHPASMGHGIDGLQDAGHIVCWYGLNWSLDLYDQFNARVRRQGQAAPVICHRILTQNTMDQVQSEALDEKATTQTALRKAIKRYRESKKTPR